MPWKLVLNGHKKAKTLYQNDFSEEIQVEGSHTGKEPWFAIRVKSRCERVVANIIQNKGFKGFLPLYRSRRRWSDREKSLDLPLFPGYLFCRLNPQRCLPVLTIPGVLHLVGIGKMPLPVDEQEIEAIQRIAKSSLVVEPWPFLEIGHRVLLEDGPLRGLEGILVGTSKQEQRVIVSVTLLRRSVAVSIDRHWVTPLTLSGPALSSPEIACRQ